MTAEKNPGIAINVRYESSSDFRQTVFFLYNTILLSRH